MPPKAKPTASAQPQPTVTPLASGGYEVTVEERIPWDTAYGYTDIVVKKVAPDAESIGAVATGVIDCVLAVITEHANRIGIKKYPTLVNQSTATAPSNAQ